MKISVVGGAGFIGTNFCSLLSSFNKDFSVFDKALTGHSFLDVTKKDTLHSLVGSDVVVNLAAEHRDDVHPKSLYDEVNVTGARNICEYCSKAGIRTIIFTSSVAIYGFAPANTDESGMANYFNDYGRSKFLAEGVYKDWQAGDPDNRKLVIIRPTVIFGEGNRGNVFNLLKQIASRKFIMFGDGCNRKSMAYVENVAAFLEYSLSFEPGVHIYNYIDKPDLDMNALVSIVRGSLFGKHNVGLRLPGFLGVSIGYLADAVAKVINRPLKISSIRVKKFMSTTEFASSISCTGFVPTRSLQEGLERTLRYEFLEDNSNKRTFDTE